MTRTSTGGRLAALVAGRPIPDDQAGIRDWGLRPPIGRGGGRPGGRGLASPHAA